MSAEGLERVCAESLCEHVDLLMHEQEHIDRSEAGENDGFDEQHSK